MTKHEISRSVKNCWKIQLPLAYQSFYADACWYVHSEHLKQDRHLEGPHYDPTEN